MIDIDKYIANMLEFKESIGYSRGSYEHVLKNFRNYVFKVYPEAEVLNEEIVLNWCRKRDTENPVGFRTRIQKFNEFLKYLASIGIECYKLPPNFTPKKVRHTPYIFTDDELLRIFAESDKLIPNPQSPMLHIIIPVIYRLIYFCGLRPNEGRELLTADVDLDAGVLFIRKNKTHSERYVPMANDMRKLCIEYKQKLDQISPNSEYFFPSRSGKPYAHDWLNKSFHKLWEKSKIDTNKAQVCVYSLRHRYATAIMMKWLDEGADINAKLPYLSRYMGHSSFSDTAYYIHLLPEHLVRSSAIDWAKLNSLIPEVTDNE